MKSGKVLLVIAHEGFHPTEYREPKKILEEADFAIVTASNKAEKATDKDGNEAPVDITLDQVNISDYDGIFFIGGPGALANLDNEISYNIIKKASSTYLPLGAICISTRILAKAGALTNKHATGWNGDNELEKIYETYSVNYVSEPVVVDENIITASGPDAAKTFGQEIVVLMHNNKGWG
jgi:Putative intracellular protease/amidase